MVLPVEEDPSTLKTAVMNAEVVVTMPVTAHCTVEVEDVVRRVIAALVLARERAPVLVPARVRLIADRAHARAP